MVKSWLIVIALSGVLSVALGAFGAHSLKGQVSASMLSAFQTATYYQMFHTLALLGIVVLMSQLKAVPRGLVAACFLWFAGIACFSGSLYGIALGGPNWLGPVTPLGGLLLIMGWLSLLIGSLQLRL
jgi:uncharacterized membrane protein YgdD (TMEM256/DUF423 family)